MSDIEFEVGQRWDIVEGEWVQNDESGQFEVVDQPHVIDTIHAETGNLTHRGWVGRKWSFRKEDCISICAEYFDEAHGTQYCQEYMNVPGPKYRECVLGGINKYFDSHPDFFIVEDHNDIRQYDLFVYQLFDIDDLRSPHVALNIGDDKVITMLPFKLSSIDPLERDKIIRIYRNVRYAD